MNAISSASSRERISKITLLRSALVSMAYGEKNERRKCPVCQRIKNIDDLACDRCVSNYGDALNKVIYNALCEICPERYFQKRSTSLEFEIVNELIYDKTEDSSSDKKTEVGEAEINSQVQTEAVNNNNLTGALCLKNSASIKIRGNLIEVVPGFSLYKDELEKIPNRMLWDKVNCPICKNPKEVNDWVCCSCGKERKSFVLKKHLIQYSILRLPSNSVCLDGVVCDLKSEEFLLRFAVRALNSSVKDFFTENIKYLRTLLRYFPDLDKWRIPVASCIVSKVIFHAFAIVDGKPWFTGAVEDAIADAEIQPAVVTITESQDTSREREKVDNRITSNANSAKENFLKEAAVIFNGISENLNENKVAGESLAAFLLIKFVEWREATGKKNPDSEDFFSKVPFSREFLEQLKQAGNCSLKFFSELAKFFKISEKDILAEGLFLLDISSREKSLSEATLENKGDSLTATGDTVMDAKGPEPNFKKDMYLKMAKSLLAEIKSNLREAPLVAIALWSFINKTAIEREMKVVDFGRTIGVCCSSLAALKIGGNKQQCLSISKFEEVVANLGLDKEAIISEGLRILVQEGNVQAQKKFEEISAPVNS